MPQQETVHVTPEEIINFLLEEMEAGISPSYYSNLVPNIFDVYLFIDDLERLRPLEPRIREEATNALGERLAALNKSTEPKLKIAIPGAPKKRPKKYEALGEWSVEFHENTDEDARENPLVIHSTFPAPASASEERVGMLTERISKRRPDGETVTTTSTGTATATAPAAAPTERSGNIETKRASGIVYANLSYDDELGAHTYQMTKDLIKIGRGSADRWVDLKLKAKKDVSREHVQIRRDAATGQFFIKDLSSLGTTVNGKRVPASIQHVDGQEVDNNVEAPLPEKSEIGLAGVMSIEFKAVKQR